MHYIGSITIDAQLLAATGILPNEFVHVHNLSNAQTWQTYVIPGPAGKGDVCLNGPPARVFQPGDLVIIMCYRWMSDEELVHHAPRIVFVDGRNQITEVRIEETAHTSEPPPK